MKDENARRNARYSLLLLHLACFDLMDFNHFSSDRHILDRLYKVVMQTWEALIDPTPSQPLG